MSNDDEIASDDDFLDALFDEAAELTDRVQKRFTHAFVAANLLDTLGAIKTGIKNPIELSAPIFGATANLATCRAFLAELNGGTILWLPQTSVHLGAVLSIELSKVVHWISIYEAFACRAYLRFENGGCVHKLFDPIEYWTDNILDGNGIIGRGVRKFDSCDAFKDELKEFYTPIDEAYDFERIESEVIGGDRGLACARPIIALSPLHGNHLIEFIGAWPKLEKNAIETGLPSGRYS